MPVDVLGEKILEATGVEHHELKCACIGGRAGLRDRTFAGSLWVPIGFYWTMVKVFLPVCYLC